MDLGFQEGQSINLVYAKKLGYVSRKL